MIITMKKGTRLIDISATVRHLESKGSMAVVTRRGGQTIIGLQKDGNVTKDEAAKLPGVEEVTELKEAYKLVSRKFHPDNTVIKVGKYKIGNGDFCVMAGPCSIESEDQIHEAAHYCKRAGATMLRGGAFKPRSSPYSFQGLGEEGLKYLSSAGKEVGLPVVTELLSVEHTELIARYSNVLQIGARNMQNFKLLEAAGKTGKPVLLKRGMNATIKEFLLAAEYINASGSSEIMFCERGIRTFETYTRNTLDISAVPALKEESHLPVIIDPSHATGIRNMILPMSRCALAAGADGLMIETHPEPEKALSDGAQSLPPGQFAQVMDELMRFHAMMGGKELAQAGAPGLMC